MGSNPILSLYIKEGSFNGKTLVSKTNFMGSNPILLVKTLERMGFEPMIQVFV